MNRKTVGKLTVGRRNCALDSNVSIKLTSQQSYGFEGLREKTAVNCVNHLATGWKTKRAELLREQQPALTNRRKDRPMASRPHIPILPLLEGRAGDLRKMRFWSKVDIGAPEQCWDWQASVNESGYGRFKIADGRTVRAHRFALVSNTGQEPDGLIALHSCDRPQCCNPHHLRFGTDADNSRDKMERGRAKGKDQSGFENGNRKLSPDELALIVTRLQEGKSNVQIANEVRTVGQSLVSRIRVGRSWQKETAALGWKTPVAESAVNQNQAILSELARVKVAFQLRTICAVMGVNHD